MELSNGGLNDQRVADLTEMSFDIYLEESSPKVQPYLAFKVDADDNGTIDTTLAYVPGPIALDTWTNVDAIDSTVTGSAGWKCLSSTAIDCPSSGRTWTPNVGAGCQMRPCSRTVWGFLGR